MSISKTLFCLYIFIFVLPTFYSQNKVFQVDNSKDNSIYKMKDQKYMGVAVAPSSMRFEADYGKRTIKYLTITNDTKKVNSFRIMFEDVEMDDYGVISTISSGNSDFGLKKWISASPNYVTLLPGEKAKIEMIVNIPNDVEAKRAAWCMAIVDLATERTEISPNSGDPNSMSMGVIPSFGFQVYIYQNPPDLKVNEVEILDFTFSYDDENKYIHLLAENLGNGIARAKSYVELNELNTGFYEKLDLQIFNILPGRKREFDFKLSGKMPPGRYSLMGVLDFGSDDELKAASKEIIVK